MFDKFKQSLTNLCCLTVYIPPLLIGTVALNFSATTFCCLSLLSIYIYICIYLCISIFVKLKDVKKHTLG